MQKIAGVLATAVVCSLLLLYQNVVALKGVDSPLEQDHTKKESTLEGYEEPEEAVGYLLYQVQQRNLDAALRICAVSDVAEYFYMTGYLNHTENFPGLELIPPPDRENDAYIEIARLRMAYEYAALFEQLCQELPSDGQIKILSIQKDEPANPDGLYYQRRSEISDILGCRDVCEIIPYVEADGVVKELHFSLAKYKRFWKIILYHDFDHTTSTSIVSDAGMPADTFLEEWDDSLVKDVVLPKNYYILPEVKAATPEELVSNLTLYLQRGDALSAMSYFAFVSTEDRAKVSSQLLAGQNEIAKMMQWFYYRMLLYDENKLAWASRHYEDEPEYIPELLDTTNMIFTEFMIHEWAELEPGKKGCRIGYFYGNQYFSNYLVLVDRDGWMLESIGE